MPLIFNLHVFVRGTKMNQGNEGNQGNQGNQGQSSNTNHLLRILRLTESLLQESGNQRLSGTRNETASRPERATEFRRLFAPYSRPPVAHEFSRNQRNSSSSASFVSSSRKRNWKGKQKAKETWTHDFFCLPRRSDNYPPNQRYRLECVEAGLGRKKIIFNQDGDAKHVAEKLQGMFPKLKDCGGFEVLRSQGPKEVLRLVSPPCTGYSVPFFRDISGLGSALAYIRPIQLDLPMSPVQPMDPLQMLQSSEAFTVTCFGCQQEIDIDKLKDHHAMCSSEKEKDQCQESIEDPLVECDNCHQKIKFSKYSQHSKSCTGIDEDICNDIAKQGPETPCHSTVTVTEISLADALSSFSDSKDHPASTSTSKALGPQSMATDGKPYDDANTQRLVEITRLPKKICYTFLYKCHDGIFDAALDIFVRDGELSVLIAVLATNLVGKTKYIQISSSSESFNAAVTYFKGPDYDESRPLAIQAGVAVDAGGPLRQFFQDVFDTAMYGECLKLFEGSPRRVVPVNSSMTLMSDVLEIIGKMAAHSIIQGGPSFPYFSPVIYWFIVTGSVETAMQHATINDAVTSGVKYVIEKVMGAQTDEELKNILCDVDVQIVMEESNWDFTTSVKIETRLALVQWLLSNDLILKRQQAIGKFAKGLHTLGLLEYIKTFPEAFAPCFIWNASLVSNDAVLEWIQCEDAANLDKKTALIWDYFQEFIAECKEHDLEKLLKFMTGSEILPHDGLRKRPINVEFRDSDTFVASTCTLKLIVPTSFTNRAEFESSLRGAISADKTTDFNTW